jgi:hypothetical protein
MKTTDSTFHRAVSKLLTEVFEGPPGEEAYVLNPGDPGLLRQLESLSAAAASTRPSPSRPPLAAHVDHVHYGLSLVNRWIAGEENPWASADWNASWRITSVTEEEWSALLGKLREAATTWGDAVAKLENFDDLTAAGAIATVAHTAYHLGAIRQILATAST